MTPEMRKQMGLACLVVGIVMIGLLFLPWHVSSGKERESVEVDSSNMHANAVQLASGKVTIDPDLSEFDSDTRAEIREMLEKNRHEVNSAISLRPWFLLAFPGPVLLAVFGFTIYSSDRSDTGAVVIALLLASLVLSVLAGPVNYGGDLAKSLIETMEDAGFGDVIEDSDKAKAIREAKETYAREVRQSMGFGAIMTLLLSIGGLVMTGILMQPPARTVPTASVTPVTAVSREPEDDLPPISLDAESVDDV
jgi:hypothetical protein